MSASDIRPPGRCSVTCKRICAEDRAALMQHSLFEPRGMLINPRDPLALAYTAPIPVIITLFAVATIWIRLAKLDPVTIIERR